MAELTNLETKLGEVLGLAMAAQGATEKVKTFEEIDGDLATALERMHEEAKQAEDRATDVAGSFGGGAARGVGPLSQPARQTAAARVATTPLARLLATLEPRCEGLG